MGAAAISGHGIHLDHLLEVRLCPFSLPHLLQEETAGKIDISIALVDINTGIVILQGLVVPSGEFPRPSPGVVHEGEPALFLNSIVKVLNGAGIVPGEAVFDATGAQRSEVLSLFKCGGEHLDGFFVHAEIAVAMPLAFIHEAALPPLGLDGLILPYRLAVLEYRLIDLREKGVPVDGFLRLLDAGLDSNDGVVLVL